MNQNAQPKIRHNRTHDCSDDGRHGGQLRSEGQSSFHAPHSRNSTYNYSHPHYRSREKVEVRKYYSTHPYYYKRGNNHYSDHPYYGGGHKSLNVKQRTEHGRRAGTHYQNLDAGSKHNRNIQFLPRCNPDHSDQLPRPNYNNPNCSQFPIRCKSGSH